MNKNLIQAAIKAKVQTVSLGGWNLVRHLRGLNPTVKEAQWLDYRAGYDRFLSWSYAPPDFHNESTYEKCVRAEYNVKTGELDITFWDGDTMYGEPENTRCKWTLVIDQDSKFFEKTIAPGIESALARRAMEIFEEQEEKRVAKEVAKILEDLYN
jgi:hypothetical protein